MAQVNWGLITAGGNQSPLDAYNEGLAVFRQRQIADARNRTLGSLTGGNGSPDLTRAGMELMRLGDLEGGGALLRIADTNAQRAMMRDGTMFDRDMAQRRFEAERADRAAAAMRTDRNYEAEERERQRRAAIDERRFEIGTIPNGYRRAANGGLEPIPGGPADPAVRANIQREEAAARPLAESTLKAIRETGEPLRAAASLSGTFDDKFAGYRSQTLADADLFLERMTGRSFGATPEATAWWQEYNRYRNVVRNQLFGAALTAAEAAAFERADINPGMTPETIRNNLAIQRRILAQNARAAAQPYILQGADRRVIESALGVPIDQIEQFANEDPTPGRAGARQPGAAHAPTPQTPGAAQPAAPRRAPTVVEVPGMPDGVYERNGQRMTVRSGIGTIE